MRHLGLGVRAVAKELHLGTIKSFRDLLVWQRAVALVTDVYRVSKRWPKDERYGLISQIRRASVSVPSNISEGHCRASRGEYLQFLGHARGSLAEVETQVEIARNLGFLDGEDFTRLSGSIDEVSRMLRSLIHSLQQSG
jgi:four helix bundle protein